MADRSALCTAVLAIPAALFYLAWSIVALVRPSKVPYVGLWFFRRIEPTSSRVRALALFHLFVAAFLLAVAVLAFRAWQG